ncbi:sensor histidine kinase, partial [Streptomyces clavuligerus]|uniref:sensor histidine kinase n=1 Tax=Streptomyces clavuligerus TaxID=1901 RepID=UPI0018D00204
MGTTRPLRTSIRLRLTALYSGLFFVTGLVLLALTNLLVHQTTTVRENPTITTVPKSELPSGGVASLSAGQLAEIAERLRDDAQRQLLTMSALALLVMVVVSVVLGWWMAGRVLSPLHTITATARRLSSVNLHERIALDGPDDELKHLADTFDDMLDRLHRAFGSQRRFVANASHELRTPLAIQRAAIQIRLGGAREADLPRIQEELLETNRRSERLIEGLLLLATSDRGLDRYEPVDLAEVAAETVELWRPRIEEAGLRLDLSLAPVPVSGDRVLLGQLVENLVQNAVRYNVPGGAISVVTSPARSVYGLTVRNTGPLVPEGEAEGLLEPFRRLVRRGGPKDGAGLGLSIVQSIAQAHGGTVTVRANAEGGLEVRVAPASAADRAPVPYTHL